MSHLHIHQDCFDIQAHRSHGPIGRRLTRLACKLVSEPESVQFKWTYGVNRGWRRSPLGGTGGCQFYAWWAPSGAEPVRDLGPSDRRRMYLRAVRHHDDHTPLYCQREDDYTSDSPEGLVKSGDLPSPFLDEQRAFATSSDCVRVLKGAPGTGKTYALMNALAESGSTHFLYLTYSPSLADAARRYFERFCPSGTRYTVQSFPDFIQALCNRGSSSIPTLPAQRREFKKRMYHLNQSLRIWRDRYDELFDEIHAHIIGRNVFPSALPVAPFEASRVWESEYRAGRTRFLGEPAVDELISFLPRLDATVDGGSANLFPGLSVALEAHRRLSTRAVNHPRYDCIGIDECQDLTALELHVLSRFAKRSWEAAGTEFPIVLAGDEAQTVRPTDFSWGQLHQLLREELATPVEYSLHENQRNPSSISVVVDRVSDLYRRLPKYKRPSKPISVKDDTESWAQVIHCSATENADLTDLLAHIGLQEGMALVYFGLRPTVLPDNIHNVYSVSEIKGLEFQTVCVLNPGRHALGLLGEEPRESGSFGHRIAIDQLLVAVSRATERLICLDIEPSADEEEATRAIVKGQADDQLPAKSVLSVLKAAPLALEDRIRWCAQDAKQNLSDRPGLALERAKQAIQFLDEMEENQGYSDSLAHDVALLTFVEVSLRMSPKPDIDQFHLALEAANRSRNDALADFMRKLSQLRFARSREAELECIVELIINYPNRQSGLPSWISDYLRGEAPLWLEAIEGSDWLEREQTYAEFIPKFFDAIGLPDAGVRSEEVRKRAAIELHHRGRFRDALSIFQSLQQREWQMEGRCHRNLSEYAAAAAAFERNNDFQLAIACYRQVPDPGAAKKIIDLHEPNYVHADTVEWLARFQKLMADMPNGFKDAITEAEKRFTLEAACKTWPADA